MAVNAGMNCCENRAALVPDFGSGCGQNLEGSTVARTHESMHELLLVGHPLYQSEAPLLSKATENNWKQNLKHLVRVCSMKIIKNSRNWPKTIEYRTHNDFIKFPVYIY